MGIKGIYGEIGSGERVALSKLAVEAFERTGRPLRIAVDTSIWQFQIQSGKGGSNPALRTLYYRLLRLLALSIQPLFVFDGPNKPPFKRNVRTNPNTTSLPNYLTKHLLKLFGFPYHIAPGEAEAECALFQREGIVDAVLSEDVDTLMFGCGRSIRNWSSDGTRGNKSPTHVNVYDAKKIRTGKAGLDKDGMVLVALMSGGDYIPAGVIGCGIKIACEAARAGFGTRLCNLPMNNKAEVHSWRDQLVHEIKTNESGFFRVKHKALNVPEDFPDMAVLGYYINPVVSSSEEIRIQANDILWDQKVDVAGLREYVAEAFGWVHRAGAHKFIRGLAPSLLVWNLRMGGEQQALNDSDLSMIEEQESKLVKAICGKRTHFTTDGIPEIRIAYIPASIVELDLDAEEDYVEPHCVNSDGDGDGRVLNDQGADDKLHDRSRSPTKARAPSKYDPMVVEKLWILDTFAKTGIPLKVQDWEENLRNPKTYLAQKAATKKVTANGGMQKGSLDQYVRVTKPISVMTRSWKPLKQLDPTSSKITEPRLPPTLIAPGLVRNDTQRLRRILRNKKKAAIMPEMEESQTLAGVGSPTTVALKGVTTAGAEHPTKESMIIGSINPWTLSRRPPETLDAKLPRGARYSALGIYGPSLDSSDLQSGDGNSASIDAGSGLVSPPSSPVTRPGKHRRSRSFNGKGSHKGSTLSGSGSLSEEEASLSNSDHRDKVDSRSFTLNEDLPSPSKKQVIARSREKEIVSEPETSQVQTPKTSSRSLRHTTMLQLTETEDDGITELRTSQRVNRRLNFTTQPRPSQSNVIASLPSFSPSPSTLVSPQHLRKEGDVQVSISILSSPPNVSLTNSLRQAPIAIKKSKNAKRLITLRNSLEGAWKEVEEWETAVGSKVFEGVDVLDLTNG
ncbi:MAG: hypothetical protein M1827_005285 [Pycnora praestabilis]|nr:MAG: hypothetical protein M1827_005285 [Pycnora praestabilis]